MQHTTLSDSDATGRTGDGGYLFGPEFALFILTECDYTHSRICSTLDSGIAR